MKNSTYRQIIKILRVPLFMIIIVLLMALVCHTVQDYYPQLKKHIEGMADTKFVKNIKNKDVGESSFLELFEGRRDRKMAQDDPKLVKYVREYYLHPPSEGPLKLKDPNIRDPAHESEADTILSLLEEAGGKRTGGFFIEAGALDGEQGSTTLMFERYLNWTGLLIEPYPLFFAGLKKKGRNAWISNAGLSINPYPEKINITWDMLVGGDKSQKPWLKTFSVQNIPLWTILLAIGATEIDFLCLDVEFLTFAVLRTLPLDKVNIKVAMIETVLEPDHGNAMKEYLENNGFTFYKYHRTQYFKDNRIRDIIVYKNNKK